MPADEAKRNFERACNCGRDQLACAALEVCVGDQRPLSDVIRAQPLQRS